MTDAFKLELDAFYGPIELLYQLIKKNEIDIYDIPISEVTEQYLKVLQSEQYRNMENMSEFVLLAATLLEIKSRTLLPSKSLKKEIQSEGVDPRQELVERLLEYEKYKNVAMILKDNESMGFHRVFKQQERFINDFAKDANPNLILEGLTLSKLYGIYKEALLRKESVRDKIRSTFSEIQKDIFTVKDKMRHIINRLKRNKQLSFMEEIGLHKNKSETLTFFLAMLELMKTGEAMARQKKPFGDIIIEKADVSNNDI